MLGEFVARPKMIDAVIHTIQPFTSDMKEIRRSIEDIWSQYLHQRLWAVDLVERDFVEKLLNLSVRNPVFIEEGQESTGYDLSRGRITSREQSVNQATNPARPGHRSGL